MEYKTSLAGVFAHELRNALSPARAALELLQRRERDNEALQPALRTMDRSFAAALQTIDRFVDAQRIMDGTVKLQIVPIDVATLVEQAIERARPALAERRQRVATRLDAGNAAVDGDASRSVQVLAQLIENAGAAAREEETIELETRANGANIELVVHDPAPREEGFDAADALESTRAPAHTQGIALVTIRRLMSLQRGALDARVEGESCRAEFILTMPRASDSPDMPISRSPPSSSTSTDASPAPNSARVPQRILLVDDNPAVRDAYREALEELGYDVTLASNSEDALRAAEGSMPEVALIDAHLPTQNGYQLARALRARHPSSGIKLVLLSGMTLDDDMIRLSKNAGFDHCIDKSAGPSAVDAFLRQ